ncbi:TrkH family potassium uptake protein [Shouchella lonarensis]|uniref:Trk-type K+ transport system, membrane component n=1 Tax=Shouchella lonarensis TaxID=1464122 RepID=A0A1G6K2E8_9BACI|nr:TrkH family potassium uptake protein [Shouchella lonarensis]SDC25212.1 Trk-type K+ transport system, membrane component [Shouchella lonarensis]
MKKPKVHAWNPFQLIVVSYLAAMLLFSVLLYLPIFHLEGVQVTYTESLFTAVSAVSVTGLATISAVDTFNGMGIIVLALAIQLGGIGIMTLGTFTWLILGKKVNLAQRMLIMVDQNRVQNQMSGLVRLMQSLLMLAMIIEIIGGLILGTYYLKHFDTVGEAYKQGFFGALSAFTNAGFDLTGQSLLPFVNDHFVQLFTILLIIMGSIGFPVLIECREYIAKRGKGFRFSLFTKLTVSTYMIVLVVGTLSIWLFEAREAFANMSWYDQWLHALFQSTTTRSAGLSTLDLNAFAFPTLLLMSGLMVIGASPSSVGGGIRTTTLAVMVLTVKNFALGRREVKVFGRQIHKDDQDKAFMVLTISVMLLIVSLILISFFEQGNGIPLMAMIVETTSAFGTCGLSTGITPELTLPSQAILMMLMFMGRVGIVALLFSLRKKEQQSHFQYPTERIIIG